MRKAITLGLALLLAACPHAVPAQEPTPQDCQAVRTLSYNVMLLRQAGISTPKLWQVVQKEPTQLQPIILHIAGKAWGWEVYDDADAAHAAAYSFSIGQYQDCMEQITI